MKLRKSTVRLSDFVWDSRLRYFIMSREVTAGLINFAVILNWDFTYLLREREINFCVNVITVKFHPSLLIFVLLTLVQMGILRRIQPTKANKYTFRWPIASSGYLLFVASLYIVGKLIQYDYKWQYWQFVWRYSLLHTSETKLYYKQTNLQESYGSITAYNIQ